MTFLRRALAPQLVVVVLLDLALSPRAAAAAATSAAAPLASPGAAPCDDHDLLAGRWPAQWQDVRGSLPLLTDGAVAPEGAQWDAPRRRHSIGTGGAAGFGGAPGVAVRRD